MIKDSGDRTEFETGAKRDMHAGKGRMDLLPWYGIYEHKEQIITYGPVVVGGIAAGAKMLSKHAALTKEQNLKDLYCYDRSLGHYWKLRRELTNEEWLEIDKRKKNGERLSDILDDMRVLD